MGWVCGGMTRLMGNAASQPKIPALWATNLSNKTAVTVR
jgi:hypothetical protein